MTKLLVSQYLNKTVFLWPCVPQYSSLGKGHPFPHGLHRLTGPAQEVLTLAFFPTEVLLWPQTPSRPQPSSSLQDHSDPVPVPRESLAPLEHEATYLPRMARGFPWKPNLGTCSLHGLESLMVLFLIRVLKSESSLSFPSTPLFLIFRFPSHFCRFVGYHQALPGRCWVSFCTERERVFFFFSLWPPRVIWSSWARDQI